MILECGQVAFMERWSLLLQGGLFKQYQFLGDHRTYSNLTCSKLQLAGTHRYFSFVFIALGLFGAMASIARRNLDRKGEKFKGFQHYNPYLK